MKKRSTFLGLVFLVGITACDEKSESKEPKVEAVTAEKNAEPSEQAAAEKSEVDAEAAREEAERRAEEEKEQAKVEANPLTECCRALGQKAFTLRSPEYHGASKACGEAMTAEKGMSDVLPAIKKALKDKALPSECEGK